MKKATALVLALLFVLGAFLVFTGFRGQEQFAASGFSAESAYASIYSLSGDVTAAWKKYLEPALKALPAS